MTQTPPNDVAGLVRWPGYEEQSWQERFVELDRRYADLLGRATDFALRKALAASTIEVAALSTPAPVAQEGELREEVSRLHDLIKRVEMTLDSIAEGLSDEGGRVYLNSTEDADTIRTLADDVTNTVHMILYEEPGDD